MLKSSGSLRLYSAVISEESQAMQIIVESCLSPQLDGFAFVHVDCIEREGYSHAVNRSNNAHVIMSSSALQL